MAIKLDDGTVLKSDKEVLEYLAAMKSQAARIAELEAERDAAIKASADAKARSTVPFEIKLDYRNQANVYLKGIQYPVIVLDQQKFRGLLESWDSIVATVESVRGKLATDYTTIGKALPKGSDKPAMVLVPPAIVSQ